MANVIVEVPQSVTVRSIAEFSRNLSGIIDTGDDIDLYLSEMTEVDLSFVQLVEAARTHLADAGRQLRLLRPADGAVAALLGRAGFLTDPDPAAVDFWFHGALPQ